MSAAATTVSLNRRIERFEAGDAVPITRPEALGELVSLVHSPDVLRDGLPLPMIQLAGGFHWCRAKARSRGSDDPEFAYAASLMARRIDGLTGLEFDKQYLAFLANDYLAQVGTGEDEPLRQAAIDFASDVADLLYDVHPALPVLLANLALTHESRFAELRNRRDLDQAIDRTRSSLALIADGLPQKPVLRSRLISLLETRSEEDAWRLIFCLHALSLVTISGAYQRRHPPRDGAAESEPVAPAVRLNGEFTSVHAQNLGMNVFYT